MTLREYAAVVGPGSKFFPMAIMSNRRTASTTGAKAGRGEVGCCVAIDCKFQAVWEQVGVLFGRKCDITRFCLTSDVY